MRVQIKYRESSLHVDVKAGEITEICTDSGDKITDLMFSLMDDEKYGDFRARVMQQLRDDNEWRAEEAAVERREFNKWAGRAA